MAKPAVVILAAGKGKRMKSSLPKVLHELLGRPMISYVHSLALSLDPERIIIVIRESLEEVKGVIEELEESGVPKSRFVRQEEPLGTGHALMSATPELEDFRGTTLVLSGDTPLLELDTARSLLARHKKGVAATLLTAKLADPHGYGRIIRSGKKLMIVEETDATPTQKKIHEVNTGTYCFDTPRLLESLPRIGQANEQGEYYLTDLIGLYSKSGAQIVTSEAKDVRETLGINSRHDLVEATRVIRDRVNDKWLEAGVTIVEPHATSIGPDVTIARDTVIYPYTFIEGRTEIGHGCRIGPFTRIYESIVEDGCVVEQAVVKKSLIGKESHLGPFCSVRPGTRTGVGTKIGTFVEIKKSEIGDGSKVPHLSYIGDASIGGEVNVGAGSITCNYDGYKKYRTVIEDGAFIGSDTMFVAPVKVGKRAVTGAGSVISEDVPPDSLGIERTQQKTVRGWAKKIRRRDRKKS